MVKQSSHKRWKGCPMCGIHKDNGISKRTPISVLRKIGRNRRITRHEIF